jgi:hypothetical protein
VSSIILSFIAAQDPYSDRAREEGLTVTLVNHLLAEKIDLTYLLLLFTADVANSSLYQS